MQKVEEDKVRELCLYDDCRKCAKLIIIWQHDFGEPRWGAQQDAHMDHLKNHPHWRL